MNKPLYLCLSILEISKIVMCEFWYDQVKPKYDKKAKLCYIGTDSFIVHVKIEYIYKDIYLKIIKEYLGLRAKTYDNDDSKKTNGTIQKSIQKEIKLMKKSFKKLQKIYKNEIILKSQQRFKSERYNIFPEEINKIVLSSNDDKRIQSNDSVETSKKETKKRFNMKERKN